MASRRFHDLMAAAVPGVAGALTLQRLRCCSVPIMSFIDNFIANLGKRGEIKLWVRVY
jgi:hypothetical protein